MSLPALAESSIKVTVAIILVIAVALVVLGLVRALVGRLRLQLVITDFAPVDDFPAAATVGLSAQLRHRVRREMYGRDAPDASSLVATVGSDMRSDLAQLSQVRREDLEDLQARLLSAPARRLLRTSADDLAPVAGGLRAIAPDRADGLVGALAAVLPRQRGTLVQLTPSARIDHDVHQVGLTIDVGPISGLPDSSATIWHDVGTGIDATELPARQRGALYDLLPWASRWIALRLVATLPPRGGRYGRARRRERARQWTALGRVLTAQLALYEMKGARIRPSVALGFVDQALEDCDVAGRLLTRSYYRPVRLEAYLEEARGYLHLDLVDGTPPGSPARSEHERLASDAFRRAADRLADVQQLLTGRIDRADDFGRAHAVRLAKTRLLAGEDLDVIDTVPGPLGAQGYEAATFEDLYNEACLWSVVVRRTRDREPSELTDAHRLCGSLLNRAADKTGPRRARLIQHAKNDADFRRTFTPAELDELLARTVPAGSSEAAAT